MMAGLGVQVPVGEGDVEAEEGREDHHRGGEQQRGQDEQRLLAGLAAPQDLAGAERKAPEQEGIEERAPVAEADRHQPGAIQRLQHGHDEEQRRGDAQQPASERRLGAMDLRSRTTSSAPLLIASLLPRRRDVPPDRRPASAHRPRGRRAAAGQSSREASRSKAHRDLDST